jgi:hypothetical protein
MIEPVDVFRPVMLAWARLQPRALGRKDCKKFGVGGLIRELRRELPENGVGPAMAARREAIQLLECHCRLCGKCAGHADE